MKKTYEVTASYVTYCTVTVEAMSEEDAMNIARDMDGGDFTPCDTSANSDWQIETATEIELTTRKETPSCE